MVVLLLAVVKGEKRCSSREFANGLKQIFENEKIDQKKVIPINLDTMKNLITSNLDSLLKTNDQLIKDDNEIESFLKTLEKKIMEIDPKTELQVAVRGNIFKIDEGIVNFSWDDNRFPKNQKTIDEILAKINEKYNATRQNLKVKFDEVASDNEKLKAKKRPDTEAKGLMKQDYREVVGKSLNKMITTEYLSTVLCFVPNASKENFLKKTFGFYALENGEVCSECEAAFIANGYTEIGIITEKSKRQQGYAFSACVRTLEEIEKRNLKPIWACDKENTASVKLAEKLGFINPLEYDFVFFPQG